MNENLNTGSGDQVAEYPDVVQRHFEVTSSSPEGQNAAGTETCRSCGLRIRRRPALGDPSVQMWIARDDEGLSWLSCYGSDVAEGCATCSGTGDDPGDPMWACPTCDGLGEVSDADHQPVGGA